MGDKRTVDTGGGDYAEGNIDKRQGAFVEGGTVYGTVIGQQTNYYQTTAAPLDRQQQRNRRAMLAKVKKIWITDFLEQSLAKELRITFDLTEQPNAVDLPLNALIQELNRPPRPLPNGTPIIEVFEQIGGALLILGAPGAGKTTLLVDLARDLIARAEQDEGHPIPVVFSLSSWAAKRQPLGEWFIDELNTKYDVPRKLAHEWMHTDSLLPLLDGLDEVVEAHRTACVEAINTYRQTHGLVPLAVCSRIVDYKALTTKLRLQGAIIVRPLTKQQIDSVLERAGTSLATLRAALHTDRDLSEILDTPLFLNIAILVYRGKSDANSPALGVSNEWRRQLFNEYINAMFKRRVKKDSYTYEQTIHWLSWLAQEVRNQKQTIFLVERLQPEWLPTKKALWQYIFADRFIGAIIFAIIARSLLYFANWNESDTNIASCLLGLIYLIGNSGADQSLNTFRSLWNSAKKALIGWFAIGFCVPLLYNLVQPPSYQPSDWSSISWALWVAFVDMLSFGFIGALATVLSGDISIKARRIVIFETSHWSSTKAYWNGITGIIVGFFFVMFEFPTSRYIQSVTTHDIRPILTISDIKNIAIFGLPFGLICGVMGGISGREIDTKITVNQGIRRSLYNSIIFGLSLGLLIGPYLGAFLLPVSDVIYISDIRTRIIYSIFLGIIGALIGGLAYGGYSSISHYILRLILRYNRVLPLNLVPFLDYCAERIFLRKVGGGYIFVHRLVMEHFASLYSEQQSPAGPVEAQRTSP